MATEKTIIRTTCPRDCYDACGIAVVKAEDGRVKILGDPDHPVARGALCGKCAIAYNGAFLDPERRLTQPLRRRGPKGSGDFVAISWAEALGEIAARWRDIADRHGAGTIWHAHYTGTCSLLAGGFPQRFFNRLGAGEIEPDSICNAAGHEALDLTLGLSDCGFDPRTAASAASLFVWGANPSASAPHRHKHWLKESPGKVVVIDPVRHETAAAADLHLQLFPGSDAALAFALLHILDRAGKLDRRFIADHVLGWDEIAPAIARANPAWASAATGLDPADIERAAQLYGAGPALIWLGQGLQRQPQGGNIFRAIAMLPAATGNFSKPGAGLLFLNGARHRGIDGDYLEAAHLRKDSKPRLSHMDLAGHLENPEAARAFVTWNINVAASNPEQRRLRQGLEREDLFHVAIDSFATDTVDCADIVLPAASFLEFDDLVLSYFDLTLSPQIAALPPMGEALPNQEIFRRLAQAMDFRDPELFESDAAMLDRLCRQAGLADFAELRARGTIPHRAEIGIQFPDLRFPTPSGKIEIASERAQMRGYPRLPQSAPDPRPQPGKLRLLSPASPWLMNSSYHADPGIARKLGPERLILNAREAARRRIASGDRLLVGNATGSLIMIAEIADILPDGTALAHKSRWPKLDPQRANVNALNPGAKADMAESSAIHGIEIEIAHA